MPQRRLDHSRFLKGIWWDELSGGGKSDRHPRAIQKYATFLTAILSVVGVLPEISD